jgi:DNA-binding transcriptional LysR family regulator
MPPSDPQSGVELRKLRYFVAVAAEANFGRAAARLYMTQPALSRQIQSLEAEIGVRLFDRDRRGARLTPAGEQFRDDAKHLLELFVAARHRARQAARPASHFTVGFMPGVAATPVIREFAESLPGADISVVHTSPSNQVDYLLAGRVDVCFVQLPISPRLFEIVPLFLEPQVIALPAEHPLATKGTCQWSTFPAWIAPAWTGCRQIRAAPGRAPGGACPSRSSLSGSRSDWDTPFFPRVWPGSTTAATYAICTSPGSMTCKWP